MSKNNVNSEERQDKQGLKLDLFLLDALGRSKMQDSAVAAAGNENEAFKIEENGDMNAADIITTSYEPLPVILADEAHSKSSTTRRTWRECLTIRNSNVALAVLSLCALMQNILVGGANNAILTTIERVYYMTSLESALFLSFYDISNIIASPIIGYFGDRVYKPRMLALSMFGLTLGSLVMVLPEFLTMDALAPTGNSTWPDNRTEPNPELTLCMSNIAPLNISYDHRDNKPPPRDEYNPVLNNMKFIFYFGNVINGVSSVALYTIAVSFLENIFPKDQVNLRQGIYYAIGAIGVGIGMLATGNFLNINGNLKSRHRQSNSNSVNWIGAWWLIYLIGAPVNFILCLLLLFFSPSLILNKKAIGKKYTEKIDETLNDSRISIVASTTSLESHLNTDQTSSQEGSSSTHLPPPTFSQHLTDFFYNAKRLLSNRIYLFIVICTICETFLIKGFSSYLTKYLEYQYRTPASTATMMAGGIGFISLVFGTMSGAFLVKRFKWTIKQCSKFVTVVLFFTSFLFLGLITYCPQEEYINGQNSFYQNSTCKCDENTFYPVCYSNEYLFQTPCHAGCTNTNQAQAFTNCTILSQLLRNKTEPADQATLLPCSRPDKNCIKELIFVGFVGLGILFLSSIIILPLLRILLESIGPDNQSFGLGIRSFMTKLFGNIPGKIKLIVYVE